jgi:hypothetical protein
VESKQTGRFPLESAHKITPEKALDSPKPFNPTVSAHQTPSHQNASSNQLSKSFDNISQRTGRLTVTSAHEIAQRNPLDPTKVCDPATSSYQKPSHQTASSNQMGKRFKKNFVFEPNGQLNIQRTGRLTVASAHEIAHQTASSNQMGKSFHDLSAD